MPPRRKPHRRPARDHPGPHQPAPETIAAVRAAGIDPDLFTAYCSHQNTQATTKTLTTFTENYAGTWDTERDYAAAWADVQHAADGTPAQEPFAPNSTQPLTPTPCSAAPWFISLSHGNIAAFRTT